MPEWWWNVKDKGRAYYKEVKRQHKINFQRIGIDIACMKNPALVEVLATKVWSELQ